MPSLQHQQNTRDANPPAFNIPTSVLLLLAAFLVVHVVRTYVISAQTDIFVILVFAFIPISYNLPVAELVEPMARYWTPITHGFLHGDWTHLIVNSVWLVAFGSAVARRFGAVRFLLFMAMATIMGALMHYLFHSHGLSPVIGASGAVSGCMGAAVRFAFRPGGTTDAAIHAPALSLIASLKNRSIMSFVVIWFVLNWLFGAGFIPIAGEAQIAWEAHMGGFLFGWIGFALFDQPSLKEDY